jgi:hypothetical protein
MFIPDPYLDFYPSWIPDPGVKKTSDPNPGSGSAATASSYHALPVTEIKLRMKTYWTFLNDMKTDGGNDFIVDLYAG